MILGIIFLICMTLIILTAIIVVKPNKFSIEKTNKDKKFVIKIDRNKKED